MIYISAGENARETKYEIKKIQYLKTGSGLNKIFISPKSKDNTYENVIINIWGDELKGIKARNWDTKEKGDEITIRAVSSVDLQPYNGKQWIILTVPSNGYSISYADGEEHNVKVNNSLATEDYIPF